MCVGELGVVSQSVLAMYLWIALFSLPYLYRRALCCPPCLGPVQICFLPHPSQPQGLFSLPYLYRRARCVSPASALSRSVFTPFHNPRVIWRVSLPSRSCFAAPALCCACYLAQQGHPRREVDF
jgi:hypothetical protein